MKYSVTVCRQLRDLMTSPAGFRRISFTKNPGTNVFFNTSSPLIATGTLTLTDGIITNNPVGTIEERGPVSIASTFDGRNESKRLIATVIPE